MKRIQLRPVIGGSFNPEMGNVCEDLAQSMAGELEYYRPRGFSKLARELRRDAAICERSANDDADASQRISEAVDEACDLLTEWARRVEQHGYISFACEGDFAGFRIDVDRALEDADFILDDTKRGASPEMPRGFSGLYLHISDHGNVSAYRYSRGRKTRELFAVV